MYRKEHPSVFRHRHSSRFEKPPNFPPLYPPSFPVRRPFFSRRRILCNRSQNYNDFAQGNNTDQSTISFTPSNNFEASNANSRPYVPVQKDNLNTDGFACSNLVSSSLCELNFNSNEDLWIETQAPNGRIYYYNANSRATCWDRPENVKIINLNEVKALTNAYPVTPKPEVKMQNPEPVYTPINQQSYVAPFPPASTVAGMSPGLFVFPPPNLYSSPPFQMGPSSTQNPLNVSSIPIYNFDMGREPCVQENVSVDEKDFVPFNHQDTGSYNMQCNSENLPHDDQISGHADNNSDSNDPSLSDMQKSDEAKQIYLLQEMESPLNATEDHSISDKEIEMKMEAFATNENSTDCTADIQNFLQKETENKDSSESNASNAPIDKSRPVCSIPVPGSKWCIVWTGEERVFYYDAELKISVWEMPEELKDRQDVQKLIESPPIIEEMKESKTSPESNAKKSKLKMKQILIQVVKLK
ncbi:hypothetical protein CEXT_636241 [Caerostris extrusa]|uniref:WW domain-containing protein n=1 Tax=Caerostris extrusa TaxID=172846 RepID=A0AAV4TLW6_CAEEX|nr:hypothetical protein CEXT_636241 [Caerostris extrusa]